MALGSSAFLRYNNRLGFLLNCDIYRNKDKKSKQFKRLPIFFVLKILLSVLLPLSFAAFVSSGGHIGLRNSF
jgi:hypothetical protein